MGCRWQTIQMITSVNICLLSVVAIIKVNIHIFCNL